MPGLLVPVLLSLHQLACLCGSVAAAAPLASHGWAHDWETPASAWWGYGAYGDWAASDAEIEFIAKTYKIVLLSLTNADITMHMSVAEATLNVSARLKAANPSLKVLQYFNMQMFAGYSKTDPDYAVFLQHPEWCGPH